MIAWGALNSAIPVAWSAWLTKGISDEPESGGGLIVGAIQLSIMLCAAFGGSLLDHLSIAATLIGGTVLLVLASLIVGNGDRIKPLNKREIGQEFRLRYATARQDGSVDQKEQLPCESP
jgi:predicted MFS family arabinose efflux permease